MRTLITGIAGFIGSHLAELLHARGHKVVGIDNFSDYYDPALKRRTAQVLEKAGIQVVEGDLRDAEALAAAGFNFEYLFHAAAHPGLAQKSQFEDYLGNNVVATQHMVDFACKCEHLQLFTYISTSSVYGGDVTCDEHQAPTPISKYGWTKLAAEQLVLAQARTGNFNACSLRLYSVYGSRERPDKLFSKLINCALTGAAFTLFESSLSHQRSFTHVSDAVRGLAAVMGKEDTVNGEIFNIGSDAEYSTEDGIRTVEKIAGTAIKIDPRPPRPGDQQRTKAVIDKAREVLNYQPNVTLEQGLLEQYEWAATSWYPVYYKVH